MLEVRKMGKNYEFKRILYEVEFKVDINILLYQFFAKILNICLKNAAMPSFKSNLKVKLLLPRSILCFSASFCSEQSQIDQRNLETQQKLKQNS